jgi:hypothetical protein
MADAARLIVSDEVLAGWLDKEDAPAKTLTWWLDDGDTLARDTEDGPRVRGQRWARRQKMKMWREDRR